MDQANKHKSDKQFSVGNYMFLKLQSYKQGSLKPHRAHKLLPKYFGPFKIVDRIGQTTYRLELPPAAGIHDVFHVSQLKLCPNPPANTPNSVAESILARKMVQRGHLPTTKVLINWKNTPIEAATWEFYYDIIQQFLEFHP